MKLELHKQIAAPPERVFAVASDFANAPKHIHAIRRIEVLTPGPIGAGTRFKETRVMFGREATEEMTVAEFDPPRRYLLTATSCGMHYRCEMRFAPKAGGTEVTMTFEGMPQTLFARIMGLLMRPMVKKMLRECAKDLDDVESAALGRAVAAT